MSSLPLRFLTPFPRCSSRRCGTPQRLGGVPPKDTNFSQRENSLPVPAVLALGVFLFRGRGEAPQDDIFSLEGCFDRVAREIAGDAELAAGFNRFITESLSEEGDPALPSDDIYIWNEPYFWEGLSDDELRLVEEEAKKEFRS